MTLEELFGAPVSPSERVGTPDTLNSQSNVCSPQEGSQGPLRGREQEEPYGVSEVTTPSGVHIYYQAGPKRLYKIAGPDTDYREVPSVSEVKGILDKPGLPWWGMKVGVEGILELLDRGVIGADDCCLVDQGGEETEADALVRYLTQEKLTVNHVKNQAGDRGTAVHDALEAWAERGVMPIPEVYPENERGYVKGLVAFLEESAIQAVRSEVMVGSLEHQYAGRYDLDAYSVGNEVCVHLTEKGKGDRRAVIEPGLLRLDLKTPSNVYTEHHLQLAGYELAAVECGYEPSDDRVVVNVWPDGRYQAKVSKATAEDWLAVLGAYRALERIKGAK